MNLGLNPKCKDELVKARLKWSLVSETQDMVYGLEIIRRPSLK